MKAPLLGWPQTMRKVRQSPSTQVCVAQGSITSPQLFNIFINALLRMLTVTGQNENISHGLQIGKDQKGDNQRDENGYQFNNIGLSQSLLTHQTAWRAKAAKRCAGIHSLVWNANQCEENVFVGNR